MTIASMSLPMFFGATPPIFRNAKALRSRTTRAERSLWVQLRKNRFHGFRFKRQHPISCFVADFYCHEGKVVIELDGISHSCSADYDSKRTDIIKEFGLRVLRFKNEDVFCRLDFVLDEIEAMLKCDPPTTHP